jgi:RNA polymerase sigma-70 factor (ECF subfamily)
MYRLAPDFRDTADIRQEVSIKVWRSITHLKDPASFKRWLRTIVTNSLYDLFRKRRQLQCVSLDEPSSRSEDYSLKGTRDVKDTSPQPDEMALRKELSVVLTDALSGIPRQFKTAIVLRDVDGLSYEDIALLTKSELGTVKSRISRARIKVQKRLVNYMAATA